MVYHNLDSANYPDLQPSAPVRYVELQPSQPPIVAVPAQPVYYQPEGAAYAEVPYATPDSSETAPPMALPVNQAHPAPGIFVPPPLTPQELEAAITRPVNFDGAKYFRESRVFFKRNWCKLMTVVVMWSVVFMGLMCAIHHVFPSYHSYGYGNPVPSSFSEAMDRPQRMQSQMLGQLALMACVGILIGMPALASMFVAVFNAMRSNGPLRYKDFFSCFRCRYFCRLLPLSITLKFLTALLSMLIVPGIWFAFVTIFAVPLHREHRFLGTCASMRISIKVVHRHFCSLLGFLILNGLLQVIGFFLFGVGLLFTIPISFVALCYCYNDLIGVNGMPMLVGEP